MRYFILILALVLLPVSAHATGNGINRLTVVTQEKVDNANDNATSGGGSAQQATGLGGQNQKPPVKISPKAKLLNSKSAQLKQLQSQMQALQQKLNSVSGLSGDELTRLQHMQDMMAKMMALMNSIIETENDTQNGAAQNTK